jgi:hydroxymethylpyrimidine/phosphomethylpyrimidine kinase
MACFYWYGGRAIKSRILTIAGSDSGGGAGIQSDLKVIALLGGYGTSVKTALTAQNILGVQAIYPIPAAFIEKQLQSPRLLPGLNRSVTGFRPTRGKRSLVQ